MVKSVIVKLVTPVWVLFLLVACGEPNQSGSSEPSEFDIAETEEQLIA